ncbi:hypothetical protein ACS0TY_021127 [Phlomoides rotata]
MRFLGDVQYELRRFGYDFRAVRNKVESLANLYAQFKQFVFITPGVKYNFLTNKSIVEADYWSYICENFGREGAAQALCRLGKFEFYQQAYYIFDVNGVEMYVIDGPPVVRRGIPVGINLHGQLMNHYVSYYRNPVGKNNDAVYLLLEEIIHQTIVFICMFIHHLEETRGSKRKRGYKYSMIERMPNQIRELNRLTRGNHYNCLDNLRLDRNTFGRLYTIWRNRGGLVDGKHVSVKEQVSMFLGILAHHKKNRVVRYTYNRSGQTVSHYVHLVLTAILQLHSILFVHPEPVRMTPQTTAGNSLRVPTINGGRYRTRKGQITTNVLVICDINMKFVYVLPGWEGSASDVRILRDSVNRPHGLKVPVGNYYLCDNGYANSEGFMAPYRGVRYHLKEWGPAAAQPANPQEHFNMRHNKARNVIERAFGIMKMRLEYP